jgi:threonine synthase
VPASVASTIAEGNASSKPVRMREVLAPIRASGKRDHCGDRGRDRARAGGLGAQGFYVEPTSAAAAAGLSQLVARGVIRRRGDGSGIDGIGTESFGDDRKLLDVGTRSA